MIYLICYLHKTTFKASSSLLSLSLDESLHTAFDYLCFLSGPTTEGTFLLSLLQGTEPEEANLPANSLLRPLWSARIHLGRAQKAHPINPNPKPPAGPG